MNLIVVESPLAGDTQRNKRFAAWCCRAVWEVERVVAIASHLICPQYLDDRVPEEREAGMGLKVCWGGDRHMLFGDLGVSNGMSWAKERCVESGIGVDLYYLRLYHRSAWESFELGVWPPCTPGFGPSELEQINGQLSEDARADLMQHALSLLESEQTLSEDLFRRLAATAPEELRGHLNNIRLSAGLRARAAQATGDVKDSETARQLLMPLLRDAEPIVQEGSIYGLESHMNSEVADILSSLTGDLSAPQALREIAQDALGEWQRDGK